MSNSTQILSNQSVVDNLVNKRITKREKRIFDFLVFMLLAVSGFEYFYRSQNYILIGTVITSFFFFNKRKKINQRILITCLIFLVVETFQYVQFGGFNLRTFSGTYIRLIFAFMVVEIVGINFFSSYVRILYIFSIISLIFYFCSFSDAISNFYKSTLGNLIPQLFETDSFYKARPNIIVFCFEETLFTEARNSGPFWEPGGFGVFLILALIFNWHRQEKLITKENVVFIISIVTTFSTAAYIAFAIFLVFVNFEKIRQNVLYTILLGLFLVATLILYEKIPFLKDKIENNIAGANVTTTSRFGSALADYNQFKENPIFGFGRAGAKVGFKDEKFYDVENHRNNGIFIVLSTYGLIIFIYYFTMIFQVFKSIRSCYSLPKYYHYFAFIILLILGFSQAVFLRPFFYAFLFLPLALKSSVRYIESINSNSNSQQIRTAS